MGVKAIIIKRKSIRRYKNKNVSVALIKELINAARLAPSGRNAQPSKYFIVKDSDTKRKLKKGKIFKQDFAYKAPIIIICCGDPKAYPKAKFEPGYDIPYKIKAIRDVSIAAQNLVLRATELGLGTCYIGWMHKERVKGILGIPKNYVVPFAITLGHPAENPKARPRKDLREFLLTDL